MELLGSLYSDSGGNAKAKEQIANARHCYLK